MRICRLFAVCVVALSVVISAEAAQADPKGLWQAQDGAVVRVASCGAGLCASVASARSPTDPETGRPWTDKHNPDPALRSRPLVGVMVLYAMMPEGAGRWAGTLYNTDDGKSYQGRLVEIDHGTIRVEGCVIGICGGRNLRRLR